MGIGSGILAFWANITNDGENTVLVILFISYFGFLFFGAITMFYLHSNGQIDLANMFGRSRAELIREDEERRALRREKERSAWERSKKKGDLGYYAGHNSGGYKDGLKDGDFAMNGPKKLDGSKANTIRNRSKRPPSHSANLPDDAGTKIVKYHWEDSENVVRIYVENVPGYDSWAEADIASKGISVYWDDRESILLMLVNSSGENFYLHVPALYRDVNDVQTIWKRNKCIVKITKRVDEPWPTLDKKKFELPTEEESQRQMYEERMRQQQNETPTSKID
ncbi:hypothetical protein TrRE_jg5818 [Triparma retinervis]|uniref:CS domain-containing protein n=1 Tax=Triparma retinervis TaxID=2557542 RepID=A0A9W7AL55_9STRA|nr:hypothetical protein TrRE_jg5818 [Triparma retinervis]